MPRCVIITAQSRARKRSGCTRLPRRDRSLRGRKGRLRFRIHAEWPDLHRPPQALEAHRVSHRDGLPLAAVSRTCRSPCAHPRSPVWSRRSTGGHRVPKNTSRYNEPLAKAAADSLRRAVKVACEKARATGTPLAVWKSGRVVQVPVERNPRKARRRPVTRSAAR